MHMIFAAMLMLAAEPASRAGGDAAALAPDAAARIMARIADPAAGPIIVAHRGCHAAASELGLASAPENSLLALEHCVAIGVEVMEADVRMTRDGHLVMIHDATIDRTTTGTGRVAALSLAQIRRAKAAAASRHRPARRTWTRLFLSEGRHDAKAGCIRDCLDVISSR